MPASPRFERTLSLTGTPDQLAGLSALLASRTRLNVLRVLLHASGPLHINEVARRVGVDASPARTHLELLVKGGLAEEVRAPTGRERRFRTRVSEVRVALERARAPTGDTPEPKAIPRLTKRVQALQRERDKLDARLRKLEDRIEAEWIKASESPSRPTR